MNKHSQRPEGTGGPESHRRHLKNLARIGWLSKQPESFQRTIASLGRWVGVEPGYRLWSSGDPSDALIGIDQGHLDVLVSVSGDEECTFFRAGPGEWLGDGGLLFGEPRQLSVEAVARATILEVPQTKLRRHLDRHPSDWRYLFHLATNRMMMAADLVSDLLALPPQARIARQLLRLNGQDGSVASRQEDLAKLAGMSRATFRRSIDQLVASGAVKTSYGKITVLDHGALKRISEE